MLQKTWSTVVLCVVASDLETHLGPHDLRRKIGHVATWATPRLPVDSTCMNEPPANSRCQAAGCSEVGSHMAAVSTWSREVEDELLVDNSQFQKPLRDVVTSQQQGISGRARAALCH